MTPVQWARLLRAGRDKVQHLANDTPAPVVALVVLGAMADECDQIAEETR